MAATGRKKKPLKIIAVIDDKEKPVKIKKAKKKK